MKPHASEYAFQEKNQGKKAEVRPLKFNDAGAELKSWKAPAAVRRFCRAISRISSLPGDDARTPEKWENERRSRPRNINFNMISETRTENEKIFYGCNGGQHKSRSGGVRVYSRSVRD